MDYCERLDYFREPVIKEPGPLGVRFTNDAYLFQLGTNEYPAPREEEKRMKDIVCGVRVVAMRKRYTLEVGGPVEIGEDDLDYRVGAHREGDLAKLGHCGGHAPDDPVQLLRAGQQVRGNAGFTVEFLYLSQRERVCGESLDFWSGQKDRETTIRTGKLHERVAAHDVPAELFETSQVWQERRVRGEEPLRANCLQDEGRPEHTDMSAFLQSEKWQEGGCAPRKEIQLSQGNHANAPGLSLAVLVSKGSAERRAPQLGVICK